MRSIRSRLASIERAGRYNEDAALHDQAMFESFQRQTGLPLPPEAPTFVFNQGLKKLVALQLAGPDEIEPLMSDFALWVASIHRTYGPKGTSGDA